MTGIAVGTGSVVTGSSVVSASGTSPGGKSGNWREAMAAALGTKLDNSAQEIVNDANAIAAASASQTMNPTAPAADPSQEFPVLYSVTPGAGGSDVAGSADSPSALLLLTAKVGTFTANSTLAGGAVTQSGEGEKTMARVS